MKNSKKQAIILSIVAVATFAILIIGATYAYFQAQTGASKSTDVKVTTYTTDVLTFTTGDAINIALTQSDFASGKGNAVGNTFAKASLIANNKTNTSTKNYYVYLNIEDNTFEYSVNESTPELILTVTDNNGNEVTDISGLIHTSVTDGSGATITGYDITTATGVLTLFNNREITANPTKEEQWNIKLTFINYDKDQSKNAGNELNAKILIQKEELNNGTTLAEYVTSLYTGTQGDNNIYYHNGTITSGETVIDANDGSYRYAGASDAVNNYICLGSTESPCPDANLFRIIGVFRNQVKVIRINSIGNMKWDDSDLNTWSTSSLNAYLKGAYLTSLGTLSEKIAETTWKVGGNTYGMIRDAVMYIAYQNEIKYPTPGSTSTTGETEYSAQIGLMYVSDYGYAASPTYWTYFGYNNRSKRDYRVATTSNWMYMDLYEWTISRIANGSRHAFIVNNGGYVDYTGVVFSSAVRPSFYLESSITYAGGSGTQSDPILIN